MLIPSLLLLACTGEPKEDPITSDTGIEVEDTQTADTSEDTQDTSETDSDTPSDTEDTADTEDAAPGVYRAQSMVQVLHQTTEGEQVSTGVRCLFETDDELQLEPTSYTVTVSPTTGTSVEGRWSILQSKVSMRCLVA